MKILYIIVGVIALIGIGALFSRGSSSSVNMPEGATDEDIRRLAQQGQKIQAIKWYRALHGVGLTEAKEAVEAMM